MMRRGPVLLSTLSAMSGGSPCVSVHDLGGGAADLTEKVGRGGAATREVLTGSAAVHGIVEHACRWHAHAGRFRLEISVFQETH